MRRETRRLVGACLSVAAFFVAPLFAAGGDRHSENDALFSTEQYLGWIEYMASDELEGRGTGQPGIDIAAEYIADVWASYGVEPAGDDDSFFQNFELALSSRIGDSTRLAIATDGRRTRKPAKLHDQFVPLPFSADGRFSGNVVFAGYGITKESEDYDDYAGIDVKDKVVLILRGGPGFGDFGMREISFRAKSREANDRGASAVLIVNKNGDSKLYNFKRSGRGGDHGIPLMHITPDLADQMLNAGGLASTQSLQDRIEEDKATASAELEGVSVRGRVDIEPIMSDVRNVVGMIPGTGPQKDEIIVLGAHYDHLGIRNKEKPDFDPTRDISNGADDNASGTAMLMQYAKAYTRGESPNRTLVLIAFTAEELGLLGSRHFSKEPTIDLSQCIAMLNFDMVGRLKNDLLEVGGMRTGGFTDLVEQLAEPYGLDIRDGGGGRGPSDHTHFYTKDIPVMFFFTGIHKQYHRPEDDTPLINAEGSMRIARFTCDIIDAIDSDPDAPTFTKDSRRARIGRQQNRKPKPDAKNDSPLAGPRASVDDRPVRLGVVLAAEEDPDGLLVDSVVDGSPADKAGIRGGDRIIRIGKTRIKSLQDAGKALSGFKRGDQASVRLKRGDKRVTLKVQFGKKPKPEKQVTKKSKTKKQKKRGDRKAGKRRGKTPTRIEGVIVERIVGFLKGRNTEDKLSTVSMTRYASGFELSATVKTGSAGASLLGDMMTFVAETVEAQSRKTGQTYDYTITLDTEFLFGGESSMRVTIRIDESTGAKPGAMASAHGHGRSNPHAAASHAPAKHRRPHGGPHISGRPKAGAHDEAHDHEPDEDVENNSMPPVTLGIMPTYGAGEGEGFEIAGVVEGGAAERGGMKDDDRILSIGGQKVKDVYSYMDALRKYKAGDKIRVVVLRNEKRVELTITTAPPKTQEAA